MKVVILAGGKGTRLLPLTETIPKVLVEINRKPFLEYLINNLKKVGLTEIGIVVNYKKEKIIEYVKKKNLDIKILEQPKPLGTGHALMQAKDFCDDENVIVLNGDNLFSVEDLKIIQKKDQFCYVVGKEAKTPEKYGILVIDKDKLVKIVEKPKTYIGNLINIGMYKFTPDVWPILENLSMSERGEYEITDALTFLAKDKKVKVLKTQHPWFDLGSPKDIGPISHFLKENL